MDIGLLAEDGPLEQEKLLFSVPDEAIAFVGGPQANLQWSLTGIKTQLYSFADIDDFGIYTTATSSPSGIGANFANISGSVHNWQNLDLHLTTYGSVLTSGTNPITTLEGQFYAGNPNVFGANAYTLQGQQFFGPSTAAANGESLYAYRIGLIYAPPGVDTQVTQSIGTWTFDASASSLSYTVVPIPGALWVFMSGIIALIATSRKRASV